MPYAGILKFSPLTEGTLKKVIYKQLCGTETLGGQMDNANHTPVNDQNVIQPHNVGLKNRSDWTNESKLVTVIGKLHFDFFHKPKPLVNNVNMKVKLHRNDAKYALISSDANVAYKVVIEDIALICRRQTFSCAKNSRSCRSLCELPADSRNDARSSGTSR